MTKYCIVGGTADERSAALSALVSNGFTICCEVKEDDDVIVINCAKRGSICGYKTSAGPIGIACKLADAGWVVKNASKMDGAKREVTMSIREIERKLGVNNLKITKG